MLAHVVDALQEAAHLRSNEPGGSFSLSIISITAHNLTRMHSNCLGFEGHSMHACDAMQTCS